MVIKHEEGLSCAPSCISHSAENGLSLDISHVQTWTAWRDSPASCRYLCVWCPLLHANDPIEQRGLKGCFPEGSSCLTWETLVVFLFFCHTISKKFILVSGKCSGFMQKKDWKVAATLLLLSRGGGAAKCCCFVDAFIEHCHILALKQVRITVPRIKIEFFLSFFLSNIDSSRLPATGHKLWKATLLHIALLAAATV